MTRSLLAVVVAACGALTLGACGTDRVRSADGAVHAAPEALAFGQAWVGHPLSTRITVTNASKASRSLSLTLRAPFEAPAEVVVPGGSSVEVEVRFAPEGAGSHTGELAIDGDSVTLRIPLSGTAQLPPACVSEQPCLTSAFDPVRGECVTLAAANGTACATTCIAEGACVEGACMGTFNACDDQNACTADACAEGSGCVHSEVQCGDPTDPCKVALCDPATGCSVTDALDGTSCGASDCVTSRVCLGGVCQERVTPNGAACGSDSPCQPNGTCQDQQCVRPPPVELAPAWEYTAAIGSEILFGGVIDASGAHYWLECAATCDLVSLDRDGVFRFRVPIQDRPSAWYAERGTLVVSGAVVVVTSGRYVQAFSTQTGAALWQHDVTDLFPPPPGTSQVDPGPLVETLPGKLRIRSNLYAANATGGMQVVYGGVFGLDASTGNLDWAHLGSDVIDGLVADDAGRVWFRRYPSVPGTAVKPALVALDGNGAVVFNVPTNWGTPVALWKDRLLQMGSALISTSNGGEVKQLLPYEYGGYSTVGGRTPVTAVTTGFGLAAPCDVCNAQTDVAFIGDILFAFDPDSGEVAWSALLPNLLGEPPPHYDFSSSYPLATSTDTVLIASGRWNSGWSLAEVDAQGEPVFQCDLAGVGDFTHPAVLHGGRWTSLRVLNGLTSQHTVASYDVARELPASGWSSSFGTPSGAGRPR